MAHDDDQFGHHVGPSSEANIERILGDLSFDDVNPPAPPSSLWHAINHQIGEDHQDVGSLRGEIDDDATRPPDTFKAQVATSAQSATADNATPMPNAKPTTRHFPSATWLAIAAAVVAIVGVGVVAARRSNGEVVAQADLIFEEGFDPLGANASATAQLVEDDGRYVIVLDDSNLPDDTGPSTDLELWLIEARPDGSLDVQPVSLVDVDTNRVAVPTNIDPTTHNIVDISIESRDGDPAHSGRSILRGPLREV